jgi:threonine dehydratase
MVDAALIADARRCLAASFPQTPLVPAASLCTATRAVYLKDETGLPTGSFKVRGALFALLRQLGRGPVTEVVAASTGNHGAAVAYAAQQARLPARIFLPVNPNPVKAARIRDAGAELVESGEDLSDAIDAAAEYAARTGAYFLHDARDPDIPAGTATIGAEILEQLRDVDAVFVPMGDTALIRGVAAALRMSPRKVHVIGVVAANAPAYFLSWQAGVVIRTAEAPTAADGLAVRRPLAANVADVRVLVDEVVMVSEQEMFDAVVSLHRGEGLVTEPSGAASVAALRRDATRVGKCVAVVTGQNIAPDLRARLLGN